MLSHSWSRGTLFNPSSPNAAAAGFSIKSKICTSAEVNTASQSAGLLNENSVVDIMKFVEFSLPTLKGRISQMGLNGSLYVYKLYYLLQFVCLSLFKRTSRILSAYVDDKPYSVELAGAVSSIRNSSYNYCLIVL